MYNVSDKFKQYIKHDGYIDKKVSLYKGSSPDLTPCLKEYTKTMETSTFTTSMQEIEAKFEGKHDLQGEELQFELGTRESYLSSSSDNEWLNFGTFKVVETEYDDASNETTVVAYDKMIAFHVDYNAEEMGLTYPTSVYNILKRTCEVVGVELATHNFFNKDAMVEEDKWANRGQITYRNVLDDVAEVALSYIFIQDDKLHVTRYNETNEVISEENLSELSVGDKYGAVNIVNLTREPQHDNLIRPKNWTDIPREDRVELVIADNQIMDKRREEFIDPLYNEIKGLEYFPFEAKSFGYSFLNAGDKVTVKDVDGNEYDSFIHKSVLKVTNGLSETLSSYIPKHAKEEYALVTDQQRKDVRTYLIVDQQNGKIESLVEDVGGINDRQSKIEQTVDEISLKVEGLNNNANIIPNLNGNLENYMLWWFYDTKPTPFIKNMPFRQYMPFNANFEILEMPYTLSQWGLSFFGEGKALSGSGYVVPDQPYSFRARRYSGTQPFSITVKQYDHEHKWLRDRKMTFESPKQYESFTIKMMEDVQYVRLEFDMPSTVNLNNRLELTEMMFNRGNPKEWQESAGDVKLYAKSNFEVLDNEIRSTVEEIKIVDGKTELNKSQISQQADRITSMVSDVEGNASKISQQADQITSLVGDVDKHGSLITQNKNEIDLKVSKDGVIGGINASPERVKINSSRLEFDNAVGKNVDLSGKITANSGRIGGYDIKGNYLEGNDVRLGVNEIKIAGASISSGWIDGLSSSVFIDSRRLKIGDKDTPWIYLGGKRFVQGTRGSIHMYASTVQPTDQEFSLLGTSDNRWDTVYLRNQPNVSSDIRQKSMIEDIPKDLIKRLSKVEPKKYVQNGKVHFGYIAQDIERELYKYCVDKYGWDNAQKAMEQYAFLYKSESHLSLLYGEIAVLKDAQREQEIKELKDEVQELKQLVHEILENKGG